MATLLVGVGGTGCRPPPAVEPPDAVPSASASPVRREAPPKDSDHDGVADAHDRCPNAFAHAREWRDMPGCPMPSVCLSVVMPSEIRILEKVAFARGSAKLRPSSAPMLDEIARVLVENPEIEVDVRGRCAADEGSKIARKRSEAVKAALVSRGVDESRLFVVDPLVCEGTDEAASGVDFPSTRPRS